MKTKTLWLLLTCSVGWVPFAHGQNGEYAFSTVTGMAGSIGSADGTNSGARFHSPSGVAIDSSGNLFVSDIINEVIRKIALVDSNWVVTTICGLVGTPGSSDGTNSGAQFDRPNGVAIDQAGTLFVADHYNHTIRKIVSAGTNWIVTTIAGLAGVHGNTDGTNGDARFWSPTGIAVDTNDCLYVVDTANFIVRRIEPEGTNWVVSTIAGSVPLGSDPVPGFVDGTNGDAQFNYPDGITIDKTGRLYVADWGNNAIRQILNLGTNWIVSTIAGASGVLGSDDGPGSLATFRQPLDLCVDASGNLYVSDQENDTIRKIVPSPGDWIVRTIAGTPFKQGASDGVNSNALFKLPWGITVNSAGELYVADNGNQTIRKGVFIPSLGISIALQNVLLSWPTLAAGYGLETSTSLDPGAVWSPLSNKPITNGLNLIVADPPKVPPVFYRLRKQ
jgi:secreted PhoX family phosphatase